MPWLVDPTPPQSKIFSRIRVGAWKFHSPQWDHISEEGKVRREGGHSAALVLVSLLVP